MLNHSYLKHYTTLMIWKIMNAPFVFTLHWQNYRILKWDYQSSFIGKRNFLKFIECERWCGKWMIFQLLLVLVFFDPFVFHLVFSTIQTLKISKSNPFTMPPQVPIVLQVHIFLFQEEHCCCGWVSYHTWLQYNFIISSFYIFPSLLFSM
jgi:hypothetical protein